MQETPTLTSAPPIAPLAPRERIEALDVIRGFALFGICLMNLDFFNRSVLLVGTGMPPGLTGIDYAAAFFTAYFVTGKFWTIFSLLFGMGFAVMLTRAESAGRSFLGPYLRRIAGLAVFGAIHHIFIWGGDILFSYAVAALFLLLALYGGWKLILGAMALFGSLAAVPGMQPAGAAIPTLIITGLVALYLRNDWRRFGLPAFSLVTIAASVLLAISAGVMIGLDVGPKGARGPIVTGAVIMLILGLLAKRYHNPVDKRPVRAGATLWVVAFSAMTIGSAAQYFLAPQTPATPAVAQATAPAATDKAAAPAPATTPAATAAATGATAAAPIAAAAPAAAGSAANAANAAPAKPAGDEAAKRRAEREKRIADDARIVSTGTYWEGVVHRAGHFIERPAREAGFAGVLIGMFLIGTWFVRSGIMANTGAHLPLFRKLAIIGIPLGVGIGLLGSLLATGVVPGENPARFQIGFGLLMLGNLPASLGYASAVVLMLHSASWLKNIKVLAPFGRMALTNYLMQSAVCAWFFYSWGLGNWGMGRAMQLVFAVCLCVLQVIISRWWLSAFRYGPLEWVWRAVTYMQWPPMRIEQRPVGGRLQPN